MGLSPETRMSLLARLRGHRDEEAWGQFVAIYEPLVYRLARQRGWQDADARELTQEILLAVANAIGRWDADPTRGSFRGWLFCIARNLMVNFWKRRQRQPIAAGGTAIFEQLAEQPPPRVPKRLGLTTNTAGKYFAGRRSRCAANFARRRGTRFGGRAWMAGRSPMSRLSWVFRRAPPTLLAAESWRN